MKILTYKFLVIFAITLGVASAQPLASLGVEVRGTVQRWVPSTKQIIVDGKAFTLSNDVQVIDRNTALQNFDAIKPGTAVMLLLSPPEVTHVVVNPGLGPVMDQPNR